MASKSTRVNVPRVSVTRKRVLSQGPGKEGNEGEVKEGAKPLKSLFTIGVARFGRSD